MKIPWFGGNGRKKDEPDHQREADEQTQKLDDVLEKLSGDHDKFHEKADEIMTRIKKKGTSVHAKHERDSGTLPAVPG